MENATPDVPARAVAWTPSAQSALLCTHSAEASTPAPERLVGRGTSTSRLTPPPRSSSSARSWTVASTAKMFAARLSRHAEALEKCGEDDDDGRDQ